MAWIGVESAVMRSLCRSVVVKWDLSQKGGSEYTGRSFFQYSYGHELWSITNRIRSQIQVAPSSGWLGEKLGHPERAHSRAAAPPDWEEPVKVAQASDSDASWTSPWGGVPGMSHCGKASGKTQDTLERLRLWRLRIPAEKLEKLVRVSEVCASLLRWPSL